jgi:hypothetical protein
LFSSVPRAAIAYQIPLIWWVENAFSRFFHLNRWQPEILLSCLEPAVCVPAGLRKRYIRNRSSCTVLRLLDHEEELAFPDNVVELDADLFDLPVDGG